MCTPLQIHHQRQRQQQSGSETSHCLAPAHLTEELGELLPGGLPVAAKQQVLVPGGGKKVMGVAPVQRQVQFKQGQKLWWHDAQQVGACRWRCGQGGAGRGRAERLGRGRRCGRGRNSYEAVLPVAEAGAPLTVKQSCNNAEGAWRPSSTL